MPESNRRYTNSAEGRKMHAEILGQKMGKRKRIEGKRGKMMSKPFKKASPKSPNHRK